MNNTEKLQKILNNIIDKCDGITFYRLEVDGQSATYYRRGKRFMYIELENSGTTICVNDIHSVNFVNDDLYFATFEHDGQIYGLNITKDMSPSQIFEELCADTLV